VSSRWYEKVNEIGTQLPSAWLPPSEVETLAFGRPGHAVITLSI